MLKVAITGNIASGKSTVEGILKEKGFKVLDTDDVAHSLLSDKTIKKHIITSFYGQDILEDGEISRPKLGRLIFSNNVFRAKLEEILHPAIKVEIGRFFRSCAGEEIAFVSVPLLFEAQFESLFDKIILVYADDDIRLKRLIARNNLPLEYAQQRLDIQMPQSKKVDLCDCVIYNNADLNELASSLEQAFNKIFK